MSSLRRYRLGHDYRDSGSMKAEGDQFLSWINLPGSGMRNMGGIRPLKFTALKEPVTAAIVLVTDERSAGSTSNPWDDLVDIPHGRIVYWGDAKFDTKRTVDDFPGNRALRDAFNQVLDSHMALVPPILHFSKRETGVLRFNGLCVLDQLELTWFEDHDRPVRNYRAHLTILDEEFVEVDWLHSRMSATSRAELAGGVRTLGGGIRTGSSTDCGCGRRLCDPLPRNCRWPAPARRRSCRSWYTSRRPVSRRRLLRSFESSTRCATTSCGLGRLETADSTSSAPSPCPHRSSTRSRSSVRPSDMREAPRLAQRTYRGWWLGSTRGQYGIFVTTSYFTKQAQEEVFEDRYPTSLVAGADLVRIMRELRIARGGRDQSGVVALGRVRGAGGPDAAETSGGS